jgi:pimeloyl-ACP methyl ester carboxylesterase
VLIHGYRVFTNEEAVAHAGFRDWQLPGSRLVTALAKDGDVFSYAYSQNAPVDAIVASGGLTDAVRQLRAAGYKDIVLVGHSAGGLIVRQFVEDNPEAGVTKVVQVCPPNGGSNAAAISLLKAQRPFLQSLTVEGREKCLSERVGKAIPAGVQFVCILSNAAGDTDGLVRCDSQWTCDLRCQGVPVAVTRVEHRQVPRDEKGVEAIGAAVRLDQPRWKPERVRAASKELFKQ